ncbi:growth/differentiation factor 10 isoform X2 [Pungitius pungitius]|uniref:growth/differentiation factor 10 isoform X2 n=1 Tax=Pungitius pungitius TaxID=134920 RepID=UPI00188783BD|nr:growth/differentiation factor 10 isoform X2 [Pungitius pungitius]
MAALCTIPSHLLLLILHSFLGAASVRIIRGGYGSERDSSIQPSPDPSSDELQDMLSRHMAKLYEKYSRENRLREGNTVRSFRTIQDSSEEMTVYTLNLTTLQDSEVVLSASFHFLLNRRPHQKPWLCKRLKRQSCRSSAVRPSASVSLLLRAVSSESEVRPGSMGSLLANVTFHPHRRGVWQMKDVTEAIKEARDKGHLVVSVELDYQRKPEGVLPGGSLPYLLLYADDQALAEPNSVAASLQRYDPFNDRPNSSPETTKGRGRREAAPLSDTIQNNELPEVDHWPDRYRKEDLWESTWYLALKPESGRKEKKRKSQKEDGADQGRGELDKEDPLVLREGERDAEGLKADNSAEKKMKDSRRLTTSDGLKHEWRKEGMGGELHKANANSESPVLSFDEQTMRKARRRQWGNSRNRGCSRRNLRVDFADIGWSHWVIAPKAFDAYYCAGTCGFPMPKTMPSNHATIQSIVRAVGIIPGVPEPCCVPERMSPLAVLYQDESRNPVLKVYPNMSVLSCSCR